jgi:hypothetical protein
MKWVPEDMWLTYMPLSVDAGSLDYDLAMSAHDSTLPQVADTGVEAPQTRPVLPESDGLPWWPILLGVVAGAGTLLVLGNRRARQTVTPT